MSSTPLALRSQDFLAFLDGWMAALGALPLANVLAYPEKTAILSIDVIQGFCTAGPLASPRVGAIVAPIVRLFQAAWAGGVRQIGLIQEWHEPDAVEFGAWPPHCVRGTAEAEAVAEIQALPFYSQMARFTKNSIEPFLNTGLSGWLESHPELDTFVAVGDCTDLCTYQLAMHLRLEANARQRQRRVIVPVNCTDTYDRSVAVAAGQGGLPHDADLMHAVFLYHMALNGIEVVSQLV